MYILLRHGDKVYNNNNHLDEYRLDSPLSDKGVEEIKSRSEMLSTVHPDITKIYTSPYLRTLQTANIIKSYYPKAILIIDPDISEYLGHQQFVHMHDLRPETISHNPPIKDNLKSFRDRLKRFHDKLCNEGMVDTLVVTHGYCISILDDM